MIFKYKTWRFFVYYRKTKRDFAVKAATKRNDYGTAIPPTSTIKLIEDRTKLYLTNQSEYAGMNIYEFLHRMLNESDTEHEQ